MPGRSYSSGNGYRYGFNGKENDNEVKGDGNQQDYGMRIYDPRLGRFLSVDPLTRKYPWYSTYQFSGNMPIKFVDVDGLEPGLDFKLDRWNEQLGKGEITEEQYKQNLMAIGIGGLAGAGLALVIADHIYTGGQVTRTTLVIFGNAQLFSLFYHNKATSPQQAAERKEEFKQGVINLGKAYGLGLLAGRLTSAIRAGLPQGLTASEFRAASQKIYEKVGNLSDEVIVQGSRASGNATISSDIDFAIRVDSKQFDQLIKTAFGNPKVNTAKWRTMQRAIETGKIQSGEAGLRSLSKSLEEILGKKVDISIIKKGGQFDNGVVLPVNKSLKQKFRYGCKQLYNLLFWKNIS